MTRTAAGQSVRLQLQSPFTCICVFCLMLNFKNKRMFILMLKKKISLSIFGFSYKLLSEQIFLLWPESTDLVSASKSMIKFASSPSYSRLECGFILLLAGLVARCNVLAGLVARCNVLAGLVARWNVLAGLVARCNVLAGLVAHCNVLMWENNYGINAHCLKISYFLIWKIRD